MKILIFQKMVYTNYFRWYILIIVEILILKIKIITFEINRSFEITKRDHKLFYNGEILDLNKYKDHKGSIIFSNTISNQSGITIKNSYNISDMEIIFDLSDESNKNIAINQFKLLFTKNFYQNFKKMEKIKLFGIDFGDYEEFISNNKLLIKVISILKLIDGK